MFKIKENGSNVRTEIIGGITTFFAMAYIIFTNAYILGDVFGAEHLVALSVATCISAAIGTALTAFLGNVPFAQAPGMGLNAFFTYTVCFGMGFTWQQALAIVFVSGLIFLILTISPLRSKIIASIPAPLKAAIGGGIGLFIALIGLLNSDLTVTSNTFDVDSVSGVSLSGILDMGALNAGTLLVLIGLVIISVLMAWKVKGAIFIGIVATALIGIPMGVTNTAVDFSGYMASIASVKDIMFKLDFSIFANPAVLAPLATALITFVICDMFDTVGTLIGTAGNAGMLDENGNLPGGDRALIADAIATVTGSLMGTSTVTTFVESSTGIAEGARTGLASLTTSILFLLAVFLAPLTQVIPTQATAPALIIVGVLMMKSVLKIDWSDIEVAVPCFLTVAGMPFFYSIADGIGFGFISYTIIKVCRGKFREVPVLMYILSAAFVAMYVLTNI